MINTQIIEFLDNVSLSVQSSANNKKSVDIDDIDINAGNGQTMSWFDTIGSSSIGIKELYDNPDAQVDSYTFMKAFMATLHETTHIYQREHLLYEKNNSARYIALGYMAECCSEKYYKDNYKLMPHEIAAQYSALKNGYNILCKYTGNEKKANDLICNYVNEHIEDEFIDKPERPYENVKDILDDYDNAFKRSRTKKRELHLEDYRKEAATGNIKFEDANPLMQLFINKRDAAIDLFNKAKPGIHQDFLLAKRYLIVAEKQYGINKDNYTALSSINFDNDFPTLKKNPGFIRPIALSDITPDLSANVDQIDSFDLDDL